MKININNIQFSYNGTTVLKDINCKINNGDFIAVVGPNGSGKSTLIKCINGILKPQIGTVYIADKDIKQTHLRDLSKTIAYVPQNSNGQAPVSVFDTVLLGRKPYINWKPSSGDIKITTDIINHLKLDDIFMKDINKLSGGQQQTVYIARALAQQPEILLLDEPTANLDLKHIIEIMDTLKNLCNKGLTVVIALHDINLALRYASSIIMLKEGKIFAHGGKDIITEENLEKLYDIKVKVIRDNDFHHVIPLGKLYREDKTKNNELYKTTIG